MDENRVKIVLLLDKSGSYDRGLIRGIVKYSRFCNNWEFFLRAPDYTVPDEKKRLMKKILLWNPDFIIMNDSSSIAELKVLGKPLFVTPSNKLVQGVFNVVADDHKIGQLAAQYFIDKGYKNFAFYGTDQIFWSKNRKSAFKKEVESLHLNYFEIEAMLNDNWQNNPEYIVKRLKELPKPVAILACSDEFGIHIIESAKIAGIEVPQQIAVLGVDNDEFICDLYDPPMSSIDQNPESVGFEIAKQIRTMTAEKDSTIKNITGTNFRVITRLSTEVFAVEDQEVKRALSYIMKQVQIGHVSVKDVVASTFLSRRLLEIRFRKMLKRSILEEINRIRIEAICNQLIISDAPLNEISNSFGFNSPTSFSNYFKKNKRMTPYDFRKLFFS